MPSPLIQPERARPERRSVYLEKSALLRQIAERYQASTQPVEREMARIAGAIADKWKQK